MSTPHLRYVERPVMPGARLTVWCPADDDLLGGRPLGAGDGFTISVTGDEGSGLWRAVLLAWDAAPDGVTLHLEVEGRYPGQVSQA